MIKKYVSAGLGVAVTVFFLYLALRRVSFAQLGEAASTLKLAWLVPMIGVVFTDLWIRAIRWRLLLSGAAGPDGTPIQAPVLKLFQLEAIGLGLNNILLLRLGEFLRAYLAGKELEISGIHALATIFVERALDMMALMTLFVIASAAVPETVPAALRAVAALAVVGLGLGLVAVSFLDRSLERGGALWVGRLPEKLRSLVRKAALGSRALRSAPVLAGAAALSLSLWLVDAGVYWMAGKAMGLSPGIGYGRSLVVLSTAAAASALPAAPGSFGTFEHFIKELLVGWSVAEPAALAYAGIVHLLFYLIVTFLGVACLYRLGHTFDSLTRAAKEHMA